jgi:hypothetical protein
MALLSPGAAFAIRRINGGSPQVKWQDVFVGPCGHGLATVFGHHLMEARVMRIGDTSSNGNSGNQHGAGLQIASRDATSL